MHVIANVSFALNLHKSAKWAGYSTTNDTTIIIIVVQNHGQLSKL